MIFWNIENLSFSHKKNKVLSNISFELSQGECLLICGENGAGKSTLLHILAGIYSPDSGKITTDYDLLITGSLVMQNPDIQILGQTPLEDMLITFPNPSQEEKEKALDLGKAFGLEHLMEESIEELSFGQKRKLCIGAALMKNPKLLLLDEPVAGLDYPALSALREILMKNKKSQLTQCITSHDIEPFMDIADNVLFLEKGKNLFYGSMTQALEFIKENTSLPFRLPSGYKVSGQVIPW